MNKWKADDITLRLSTRTAIDDITRADVDALVASLARFGYDVTITNDGDLQFIQIWLGNEDEIIEKRNKMKTKRNLSGIYFRAKNEETGKFDNVVFEDLTEQQQDEMMNNRSEEWLKSLAQNLANTINHLGGKIDGISQYMTTTQARFFQDFGVRKLEDMIVDVQKDNPIIEAQCTSYNQAVNDMIKYVRTEIYKYYVTREIK